MRRISNTNQRLSQATLPSHDPVMTEMRRNRKVASSINRGSSGQGSISFATGRPRDPMFYWKNNNLPYDYTKPEELKSIREWCRRIYALHPIGASALDVFSKYPLTGMELVCKDQALVEFYEELFFNQLGYEDFLIDVGREYWTIGEAWPLGSFNETLGVWEDDELINPDDVEVIRSPFMREPRFEMRLPELLREIIDKRDPPHEFEALMRSYPELKNFMSPEARMPVSNILLKQIKFKVDPFHPRGLPILMRGFRTLMQEEMLNAAQDAIADRLYTPLVLAKLGASATDLGTSNPWIPTEDDLAKFEEALDAALAGDFRVLIHHFAVQMQTVFGRENMPNFSMDFDRLTDRLLQVFGLSRTMLTGAGQGETYAADAINRDLVSQLLSTYQKVMKKFFRERALIVAEAQEHYDYEERGGRRYPIMEEVLEVDEETGEQRIVEQPKLLVPELNIKAMTMQDEREQRMFYQALRDGGVPISMETRLVNVPIDLHDEMQRTKDEQIEQAVAAQETRKATFEALRAKGLPIPDDLKEDFLPKASQGDGDQPKAEEQPVATIGLTEPADTQGLAPTSEDVASIQENTNGQVPNGQVIELPRNKMMERNRPAESDEARAFMPKPAMIRKVEEIEQEDGSVTTNEVWETYDGEEGRGRLLSGPRHVGMRRYARVSKDVPLDDEPERADHE